MKEYTMLDYINEIPEMISKNVDNRKKLTSSLVKIYNKLNPKRILLIASGSSYNAAVTARLFMQKILNKRIDVLSPYTFFNYEHDFIDDTLIMIASQTGNSTNCLQAADFARGIGQKIIGISADDNCDLKDHCDYFINYGVGIETVGFVTKGMVGLALFFMLFALESSQLTDKQYNYYLNSLKECSIRYKKTCEQTEKLYLNHRHELLSMERLFVISSGPGYGVALEGALKIGETLGICTTAYEAEEFLHGPAFNVNGNYSCIFIDNNDSTSERLSQVIKATRVFTDRCYVISSKTDKNSRNIKIEKDNPYTSVLYKLALPELLAYRITNELNRWPIDELAGEFDSFVKIKTK